MQVQNLKLLKTYPFEDYLKLPGYSYSGLRNEGKSFGPPTAKMQLGTHVHNYLMTPREYEFDDLHIVKPLAAALKAKLGPLLKYMEPELAVTADFVHEGFSMPYKGRIDLPIVNRIVVDVKVSEMPIQKGIEFFGYDFQLTGYAVAIGAPVALILSVHPAKPNDVKVTNIPIRKEWWQYQIKRYGTPI